MYKIFSIAIILLLLSCKSNTDEQVKATKVQEVEESTQEKKSDNPQMSFNIIPNEFNGFIDSNLDENNIVDRFGAKNLVSETILIDEGTREVKSTKVFEGADNLVRFIWNENGKIKRAIFSRPNSNWNIAGLKVGQTIGEIEKLNKGQFSINGFGWDEGGLVNSWHGGSFDKYKNSIKVYMVYDYEKVRQLKINLDEINGDNIKLKSGHPLLQKAGLSVDRIEIIF